MSLPIVKLSYLDGVRGFVAVGRRMSITHAADDLCITQSAVSRQVLALEEQLGVKLLVRGYRSISFTPDGERLFRSADSALQQLQDVMGDIHTSGVVRPVTLSASIGVTGLWLLPRLNHFQKLHPGVDLRVSANNKVGDLRHDGIDLAIRYTTKELAPPNAVRLFAETVAPVAHPSLQIGKWQTSNMLVEWPLLEFDDLQRPWLQWKDWLTDAELEQTKHHGMLRFNQYDQVIQAALSGQGVALGRLALIQPLLNEGKLVMRGPPKADPIGGHAYWLIQSDESPRKVVRHVVDWITKEAEITQAETQISV